MSEIRRKLVPLALLATTLLACRPETIADDTSAPAQTRDAEPWYRVFDRGARVTVQAGQPVTIRLEEGLDSGSAVVGEVVRGVVDQDVRIDGDVAIPAGATVKGSITEVRSAKRFGGQASITVTWHEVETDRGDDLPVTGALTATGRSSTGRDTATIAGSAVGGALLGGLLGNGDEAAAGAIVGGGVGTAVASRRGDEAVLQAGATTVVHVAVTRTVRVAAA